MAANVHLVLVLALTTAAVWCVTVTESDGDHGGGGDLSWIDGSARLIFALGSNASCPWIVSLLGENQATKSRLEICTRSLPVAFEGFSLMMYSPGEERYFSKPSTSRSNDASSSATPKKNFTYDERDSDGYIRLFGGGSYKMHEEKMTWHEAKAACEAEGAHLVIVNSKEEAAAIRDYLESKRTWFRERPFTLHAGFYMAFATLSGRLLTSLGYERWALQEPAAPVCGRIDHDAWLLFGACSQEGRFMCERESEPRGSADRSAPAAELPPSPTLLPWNSLHPLERQYSQGQPGSNVHFRRRDLHGNFRGNPWEDAKRVCQLEGARLAAVESAAEAEMLVDYFQSLPDGEPRGETLLALRTTEPMDVLGNPMSASTYLRWVEKIFPESCICIDIKVLFHTCSCENVSVDFLCKFFL